MPEAEIVRSRTNPLFKRLRSLKERGAEGGLCLLEGPKLVAEALAAGLDVLEAAYSPRAAAAPAGAAVLALLRESGVLPRAMSADLVASLSEAETSQGLVALARQPGFEPAQVFRGNPLVLVADRVQSPGNVGALLRSAEAAGASGALLTDGCADPLSWKSLRGSMGSAFRLPHQRGLTIEAALDEVERRGLGTVALAADGERRYDEVDWNRPVAILVGNEAAGLAPQVARRAQVRARIPLTPPVESLNVAVAAALVLYEAARRRGFA